ncbi:CLUMA_CG014672, isoform A [Clunio marinus]|uniref:CLUMA_CG014672, isoform A n=1 Tax=Clunio marinus TaxID=568069 RepID=A0A1J1IQE1_9DIPT|nr:CLUMA_CG014672, isoform A [Clunio marinus]
MIFKENIIAIEKHNKLRNFTYTMDDNDAADMSDKERNLRRGSKPQPDSVHGSDFLPMVRGSLPRTINYAR